MTRTTSPKPGLKFYPKSHRYELDGTWVPGVTTILGVLAKPALPKWAAKSVAEYVTHRPDEIEVLRQMGTGPMVAALKEIPWTVRDEAAERGSAAHDLIEQYLRGYEITVPDELVGYLEAAARFVEDYEIEPVLIEAAVASREHLYAGKLDLVALSTHGCAIFDWKTTKSGIYPEAVFQTNAYAHAEFWGEDGTESPMSDLGIKAAFGVWIRPDGYDVHPLRFGPQIFDEFLTIRRAYDIKRRADGDWKVPGSGYVALSHQQEGESR